MDYTVAKSWTRLIDFHFSSCIFFWVCCPLSPWLEVASLESEPDVNQSFTYVQWLSSLYKGQCRVPSYCSRKPLVGFVDFFQVCALSLLSTTLSTKSSVGTGTRHRPGCAWWQRCCLAAVGILDCLWYATCVSTSTYAPPCSVASLGLSCISVSEPESSLIRATFSLGWSELRQAGLEYLLSSGCGVCRG